MIRSDEMLGDGEEKRQYKYADPAENVMSKLHDDSYGWDDAEKKKKTRLSASSDSLMWPRRWKPKVNDQKEQQNLDNAQRYYGPTVCYSQNNKSTD